MKLFIVLYILCTINFSAFANNIEEKAKEFIYAQQKTITDNLRIENKKEKFNALYQEIDKTFATDRIYKFAVGRYAKLFNQEQKQTIIEYFKKMILITYGLESSINVQNLSLSIHKTQTETMPNGYDKIDMEGTIIGTKQVDLLKVSFVIYHKENQFRIFDIKVENIAMLVSFRNMFSKIMQDNYNDPNTLVKYLQEQLQILDNKIFGTPLPIKEKEEIYILQ